MPTFRPSTPSASRSLAAAAVAILPTTRSTPAAAVLTFSMVCITLREWACEVSMTSASTLAATRALTLSRVSAPVPTAAPTWRRPNLSLEAVGNFSVFTMSLNVISPFRKLFLSITGSFSMRLMCKSCLASAILMFSGAVIRFVDFMMVEILSLKLPAKRRSRLVRMPTSRPFSSTMGKPEMPFSRTSCRASWIVLSGRKVMGLTIMPDSERLTFSTSPACSSMVRFL